MFGLTIDADNGAPTDLLSHNLDLRNVADLAGCGFCFSEGVDRRDRDVRIVGRIGSDALTGSVSAGQIHAFEFSGTLIQDLFHKITITVDTRAVDDGGAFPFDTDVVLMQLLDGGEQVESKSPSDYRTPSSSPLGGYDRRVVAEYTLSLSETFLLAIYDPDGKEMEYRVSVDF